MGNLDSIQNLVEKAAEAMGGIDILVNNGARVVVVNQRILMK